jgi:hypothetical protein
MTKMQSGVETHIWTQISVSWTSVTLCTAHPHRVCGTMSPVCRIKCVTHPSEILCLQNLDWDMSSTKRISAQILFYTWMSTTASPFQERTFYQISNNINHHVRDTSKADLSYKVLFGHVGIPLLFMKYHYGNHLFLCAKIFFCFKMWYITSEKKLHVFANRIWHHSLVCTYSERSVW